MPSDGKHTMFSKRSVKQSSTNTAMQKFCDAKKDPGYRIKQFRVVWESFGSSENQQDLTDPLRGLKYQKDLMADNSTMVFNLFYEHFCQASEGDVLQRPVSRSTNNGLDEMELSFWLLEQMLLFLPEMLCKRWQYYCIGCVMKKLLHPANQQLVRKFGLKYFVTWYQILGCGQSAIPEADQIFELLISLPGKNDKLIALCQTSGFSVVHLLAKTGELVEAQVCPAVVYIDTNVELNEKDKDRYVNERTLSQYVVEFIWKETTRIFWHSDAPVQFQKEETCMRFLVQKLFQFHIPAAFPDLVMMDLYNAKYHAVRLKQSTLSGSTHDDALKCIGQMTLVRFLVTYTFIYPPPDSFVDYEYISNKTQSSTGKSVNVNRIPVNLDLVRAALLSSRENINMTLSVLRAGMFLPPHFAPLQTKILKTWKEWLINGAISFSVEPSDLSDGDPNQRLCAGLQLTIQAVTESASAYFQNTNVKRIGMVDKEMCDIVEVIKRTLNVYQFIVANIVMSQETWHFVLNTLMIITEDLTTDMAPNIDSVVTRVATIVFQTMLVTWVRASLNVHIDADMWNRINQLLTRLTHWYQLAEEWRKVMESLTRALSYYVYNVNMATMEAPMTAPAVNGSGVRTRTHRLTSSRMVAESPYAKGGSYSVSAQLASPRPHSMITIGELGSGDELGSLSGNLSDRGANESASQFAKGWSFRENQRQIGLPLNSNAAVTMRTSLPDQSAVTEEDPRRVLLNYIPRNSSGSKICEQLSLTAIDDHSGGSSDANGPLLSHLAVSPVATDAESQRSSAFTGDSNSLDEADPSGLHVSEGDDVNEYFLSKADQSSVEKMSLDDRDSLTSSPVDDDYYRLNGANDSFDANPEHPGTAALNSDSGVDGGTLTPESAATAALAIMGRKPLSNDHAEAVEYTMSVLAGGTHQGWLADNASVLWVRTLGLLGDVNLIQSPSIHHQVMKHLSSIVETLMKIRANQKCNEKYSTDTLLPVKGKELPVAVTQINGQLSPEGAAKLVPPIERVLPWLFSALQRSGEYADGKLVALETLCAIVFNRGENVTVEYYNRYLPELWLELHRALQHSSERFVVTAMKACQPVIFNKKLPGAALLVFDMASAATRLLESESADLVDKLLSIQALGTIAGFIQTMEPETTVFQPVQFPDGETSPSWMTCEGLEPDVVARLKSVLGSGLPNNIKSGAIKALGMILDQRLKRISATSSNNSTAVNPNREDILLSVSDLLTTITKQMNAETPFLAAIALQVLSQLYMGTGESVVKYCPNLPRDLIQHYCATLCAYVSSFQDSLYASNIKRSDILTLCCSFILAIYQWCIHLPLEYLKSTEHLNEASLLDMVLKALLKCQDVLRHYPSNFNSTEQRQADALHDLAATSILTLLQNVGQWPIQKIISDVHSKSWYSTLTLSDQRVVQFENIVSNANCDESFSMVTRGLCGRTDWQCSRMLEKRNAELKPRKQMNWPTNRAKSKASVQNRGNKNGSLQKTICDIAEISPEIAPGFNLHCCVALESDMQQAIQSSQRKYSKRDPGVSNGAVSFHTINLSDRIAVETTGEVTCVNSHLLMSELGLLSLAQRNLVHAIPSSQQLWRELKHVDMDTTIRERHKVALIYVADGMETKEQILNTQLASNKFEAFAGALGWQVKLSEHDGYAGGLPGAAGTGTTCYYSDAVSELIFHVSTRLATEEWTKKIRHLGNDEVWVVWCEHSQDYDRAVIQTDFADVLIVLYPLLHTPQPLIRVAITCKHSDVQFGPLFNGALVSWVSLATLVRCTVLNASRALRRRRQDFKWFYETRSDALREMWHKVVKPDKLYHLFLTEIFTKSNNS